MSFSSSNLPPKANNHSSTQLIWLVPWPFFLVQQMALEDPLICLPYAKALEWHTSVPLT